MDEIVSKADKATAMVRERLVKGEEVLAHSEIHLGIYWKPVVVLILGVLVAIFVAKELGILLLVVGLLFAGYNYLRTSILLAVVTNKRLMTRYGILMVDVVDIHFDKIESIELERMLPGYLMGYSNLVVMGTGNRLLVIPYVANGPALRRAYNETVLADKD